MHNSLCAARAKKCKNTAEEIKMKKQLGRANSFRQQPSAAANKIFRQVSGLISMDC